MRGYPEKVSSTCPCGATFEYAGPMPNGAATAWRRDHPCTKRKPTGLWTYSGPAPDAILRAAHAAADQLDAWDSGAVPGLDGLSPGGIVRAHAHEAACIGKAPCPICGWKDDE